jgi:hypothetical protein
MVPLRNLPSFKLTAFAAKPKEGGNGGNLGSDVSPGFWWLKAVQISDVGVR